MAGLFFQIIKFSYETNFLTTMTVGSVCVRATVNGTARVRGGLLPPSGQQTKNGCNGTKHQ